MVKMSQNNIQTFLSQYTQQLSSKDQLGLGNITEGYFCADRKNTNLCAELVFNGIKSATCSLREAYNLEKETPPKVGDIMVVTDWDSLPVCIVKVTKVNEVQFCKVDENHAFREGEGDKTLSSWRDIHLQFFTQECEKLGITFNENMTLILEEFEVVYSPNSPLALSSKQPGRMNHLDSNQTQA